MKNLILALTILAPLFSSANSRVGTLGLAADMAANMLVIDTSNGLKTMDAMKYLGEENGQVLFYFKGFEGTAIETHSLAVNTVNKLNSAYAQALLESAQTNQWVEVSTPEDTKHCRQSCLSESKPGWELKACLAKCED